MSTIPVASAHLAQRLLEQVEAEGREFTVSEAAEFDRLLRGVEYGRRSPAQIPDTPEGRPGAPAFTSSGRRLKAFRGPHAETNAYRSGQWLRATVWGHEAALDWCRDHGVQVRALGEAVNTKGGAVVPDEFNNAVITDSGKANVARTGYPIHVA